MEQTKAINALEPFVLLSKSATSPRAAADLVTQSTSAPNTYVFAELLQTSNIQSLRHASAEYSPYLTLLEIFAWGTWSDYTSTPSLPSLSEAQSHKLRLLTLLTISTSPAALTYTHLQTALSLSTTFALESLIISAIYAGLLTAKLDTVARRVDVSSVSPLRDLRPASIPTTIAVLDDWDSRCVGVLGEIEGQVREIRWRAGERRRKEREVEAVMENALGNTIATGVGGGGGSGAGIGAAVGAKGDKRAADGGEEGEEMDVDEIMGRGGTRNAKRGGSRFGGVGRRLR
ncbi:MAG: hypothetical protein M1827_001223 [Pycnora praestabilis]|nr:MAG: hypothetical protein M1827_001223 [Pycnora praestabilis]